MMQEQLPVHEIIPALKETLSSHSTAILQAPPGAGKSTVLPLTLLEEPWLAGKKILMLEPRRLAARAVAWRLAEQLGEEPGATVGYRVRFDTCIGKKTRIEVVTEGILTRMLQEDNSLEDTGLVIFDEFHERSLHADLSLALCREAQQVLRGDLRILIMSATLDGETLSSLLGNAPVLTSKGRQYPITYNYLEPDDTQSIAQNTARAILRALREVPEGDVLAFLPGSGDIHRTVALLEDSPIEIRVHPLYGDLPHAQQQEALMPDKFGKRKVVLSTSIAETSLTIEGIKIVVDSGYARVPRFDPKTGLTRLETVRATKDTTDQRAGRAGRLGPGISYRLWPERTQHHLVEHRKPEILEADLAHLVLELANWGHADPSQLTWLTPPPSAALAQARLLLENLGALKDNKITADGKQLLEFPTHPRIAHLLVYGRSHRISAVAADVAALLEERDPLGREAGADIYQRLEALQRWRRKERVNADRGVLERIERISKQWRSLLGVKGDSEPVAHEVPGFLLAAAYPERIARREGDSGKYRLSNGRAAKLPEHDPLMHEEWIVASQLDAGTNEGKIFLAAAFDPEEMLASLSPVQVIAWDERNGVIVCKNEWRIGNLVAASKVITKPDEEKILETLCGAIAKEGMSLFDWSPPAEQLRARVQSVKKWRPNVDLPDLSDAALSSSATEWAIPFLRGIRRREDFKKMNLQEMLKSLLSWEQQNLLNRLAPEKMEVPSGSGIALQYTPEGTSPVLAVRLQEVFGLKDTPTVNEGRIQVLMHLLSPGYRPVQVTQDLRSFWKNIYPEVRKELRVRYQKHSWPEDPWTAEAIRGAKKRK